MREKAKQYTREFVDRAVKLCEESSQPVKQVARDLGVNYVTLWSWMKKAGKTGRRESGSLRQHLASAPQTPEAMQAEINRLRRELDETRKQLDFAKKAAAFFAQQNK
jgi:transposase